MGSGKTTVARILAERLDRPLIDSDDQLEARYGSTGRELAAERGVPWLHQAEAEALRKALDSSTPAVIAAAASTGDRADLAARIESESVWAVLLVGDAEVLAARARSGVHRRSIDVRRSRELAEKRNERLREVVDIVVDVTRIGPDRVADRILARVESRRGTSS